MRRKDKEDAITKREPKQFSVYTDLAIEAREMLYTDEEESAGEEPEGIRMTVEENEEMGIKLTWVQIVNEEGVRQMGKPVGNYITLESNEMKENSVEVHEEIIRVLADKLGQLHKLKKKGTVLIVGLGNWKVTPDALGPKVVGKVLVTRHIAECLPEEINVNVRPVGAISPGVMGITGIETVEIVKGVVERIRPDLVIAIDALAARRTARINSTIQMSDTGVAPGGGMGNKRLPLNEEALGVPVIAIGVPTVVDAATLVNDTMDHMLDAMIAETERGGEFYRMLKDLAEEDKYALIKDVLNPYTGNMFVSPKEVDAVIERLSNIIANAINIAVHPGITREDINRYMG